MPQVIYAHRGASGYAPENTLEAFELAAKQNAFGVELDVHICKSGELVIIHDEDIKRTCNGQGLVRDMTLEELKKAMDPSKYVGRAPYQVDVFLKDVVKPILESNKDLLGVKAEITV